MRTNTAATIYQKSVISNQEVWTRTVIRKVHWENRKAVNVLASGLLSADAVSIWIPLRGLEISIAVGDVMVKGIASEEVDATTFRMSDLEAAYENVVRVKSVDKYDFGSLSRQHIRIGAS